MSRRRLSAVWIGLCMALSACGGDAGAAPDVGAVSPADGGRPSADEADPEASATPVDTAAATAVSRPPVSRPAASGRTTETAQTTTRPATTAAAPAPVDTTTAPADLVAAPASVDPARNLVAQSWEPMAVFGAVTLIHPSNRIERIGFHESNHDGARQLVPSPTAVNPLVLETRDRGTGSRTAADVVVEPGTEIRAPVTGTVIRAGGYILYCEHNDDFVVIEPDAHPGWELKVLHISGVMVGKGDRVEAGVTVLAPAATPLPFDSQVDEFTAEPSWPHVHIELVDPSIPDRPSSGGGC